MDCTRPSGNPDLPSETAEELYEMAPCGYFTTTIDGRIIKANRTLAEWLGYNLDELINGKHLTDLLTIGGRIFFETHLKLMLRIEQSVNEIAVDFICKDGRVIPVLINARQKRDPKDDAPLVNRFTVFNASERRAYERELLAARDLYRTTLSSIGEGVATTDANGHIKFLNPIAEQLSDWSLGDAAGLPVEEVFKLRQEGTDGVVVNPARLALREGIIVKLGSDTMLVAKGGRKVPVDYSASPIRGENAAIVGSVLVLRDITAQRLAAKAIQEAHERLEASAAELRRSNKDLSQFAHTASHDLRSPLSTIIQAAELIKVRYGSELGDGKTLLGHITRAAASMSRLIEDLLDYASISNAPPQLKSPTDANEVIEAVLQDLQSLVERSGAVVTYQDLPTVAISETHLRQLFQNLVGNAIHYRGDEPLRVHLAAIDVGEHWVFSCQDNGIGIEQKHQSQIFEAFKRLHGTERPGSGIGLAVCKRIVERYEGRLWVESAPGQGSTFFFTCRKAASAAPRAHPASD